jgi:hypothetical protein
MTVLWRGQSDLCDPESRLLLTYSAAIYTLFGRLCWPQVGPLGDAPLGVLLVLASLILLGLRWALAPGHPTGGATAASPRHTGGQGSVHHARKAQVDTLIR